MPLPSRRTVLRNVVGVAAASGGGVPSPPATGAGGVVDARARGAAGDGLTDDAPVLNRLIAELASTGGGILQFPRGTYRLKSSLMLASGVSLVSAAATHGYIAAGRASAVVLAADPALRGWMIDSPSDAVVAGGISGIDLQGGRTAAGGVRIRTGSWCVVERSAIDGCQGPGVQIEAGLACVLEDLLITNCVLDRSPDARTGALDVAGTDHYLSRCESAASLRAPTGADRLVVAVSLKGANHFVSDCVGEYSDIGWAIAADGSRFSNTRADTNQGDGFVIDGSGNVFAACSSVGNSQAGTGAANGWTISGGSNSFAACNVVSSSPTSVRFGFSDSVDTSAAADRNQYVGCAVDRAATAAWSLAGFLGSSPVVSPQAVRVTGRPETIDVSQAGLIVLFDVDVPASIGGFEGGVNGQTIRLLGKTGVLVVPSESVRTVGGRPLELVTDGSYPFTHYDGVWYQDS